MSERRRYLSAVSAEDRNRSSQPEANRYEAYLDQQRQHFRHIQRHIHHTFEPSEYLLNALGGFYEDAKPPRLKIVGTKNVIMPGEHYYGRTEQRELIAVSEAFRSNRQPILLGGEIKVRVDRLGRGQFALRVAHQAFFNTLVNELDKIPNVIAGSSQKHYLIASGGHDATLRSTAEIETQIDTFQEEARSETKAHLFFVRPLDITGYDVLMPPSTDPTDPQAQELPQAS